MSKSIFQSSLLGFAKIAAASLFLLQFMAAESRAAISYNTWFSQVSAFSAYNPQNISTSPYQVRVYNDNPFAPAANQGNTFGNALNAGEFRVHGNGVDGSGNLLSSNQVIQYTNLEGDLTIYKTFCIERGESVNTSGAVAYNVSVDAAAVFGGFAGVVDVDPTAGVTFGDPVGNDTKLLYGLYFEGKLDDLTGFVYGNNSWADGLQAALWAIEDTLVIASISDANIKASAQALYDYATGIAQTSLRDAYDSKVLALNLWNPDLANPKQSLLVYTAIGQIGDPVPEPASILLWSLGVAATAGFGWRSRKSSEASRL